MSGTGGQRPGAGRKVGSLSKSNQQIREILDGVIDWKEVAEKLYTLVKGVTVQQVTFDGVVVYTEKPDAFAAKILLEYRFGKPFQSIAIANMNNDNPSIAIIQQGEDISLQIKSPDSETTEDADHTEVK